jgi:TM2 domain-containing membrane protein YozV
METSNKNRLVALLLSGFAGTLGAHRFYVNKVGTGIVQLILTLSFIGLWVSAIWNLIDFIMIACGEFKDKEGKKIIKWS